eukprot:scaffold26213_cov19-Cyclotella_meneghiniana.AAC.1
MGFFCHLRDYLEEDGGENNEDDDDDDDNHDDDDEDDEDDDDEENGQIEINNEQVSDGGDSNEPDSELGSTSTPENEFDSNQVPQRIAAPQGPQGNAQTIGKKNLPHWVVTDGNLSDGSGGTTNMVELAKKHRDDSNVDENWSVASGGTGGTAAVMEWHDLFQSGEYQLNAEETQFMNAMMVDDDNNHSCEFPKCQITDSELHDCQNCKDSKFHIECLRKYLGDKTTDGTNSEDMDKYCIFCLCCEAKQCDNGHGVFLRSNEQDGVSCCAECSRQGHKKSCFVQRDNNRMLCHTCYIKSLQNFWD